MRITKANISDYSDIIQFYYSLIDALQDKEYRPGWKKGNLPAERLYLGLGFSYVETIPMFYEDTGWMDFLLYEMEL